MPAHIFELLFTYIRLKGLLGRPPSNVEVSNELGIDFCTGLQRKGRAVELGYIADPGVNPVGRDWCKLTDRGAEAFMAVLDGVEPVVVHLNSKCSANRDVLPNHIIYEELSMKQYKEYLKALDTHGHATPSGHQPGRDCKTTDL